MAYVEEAELAEVAVGGEGHVPRDDLRRRQTPPPPTRRGSFLHLMNRRNGECLCEDGCFFGREGALGRRGCDSKKTFALEECDVAPPSLFPSCLREGGEAMWGAWARGGGSGGWPGGGPRGRSGGPSPRGPRPGPGTATGTRGQRPAAQGGGSTARHPCRTPPPGGRGEEGRGFPSLSSPKGCVAVGTGDPGGLMGGGADGPAGRWGTEGSWKARPWAETLHHWREWNGCTAGEGPSAEPPEDASDDCRPAGCEEEGRKEEGRRRGVWPKPNQVNPAPIRWSAADHHQSRDPLRLQSGNVLAGYWVYFKNKGDWQRRHVPRRPLRSLRWN